MDRLEISIFVGWVDRGRMDGSGSARLAKLCVRGWKMAGEINETSCAGVYWGVLDEYLRSLRGSGIWKTFETFFPEGILSRK